MGTVRHVRLFTAIFCHSTGIGFPAIAFVGTAFFVCWFFCFFLFLCSGARAAGVERQSRPAPIFYGPPSRSCISSSSSSTGLFCSLQHDRVVGRGESGHRIAFVISGCIGRLEFQFELQF